MFSYFVGFTRLERLDIHLLFDSSDTGHILRCSAWLGILKCFFYFVSVSYTDEGITIFYFEQKVGKLSDPQKVPVAEELNPALIIDDSSSE